MSRIKFELTERLETLLEEARREELHLKHYAEICKALEDKLVPLTLLQMVINKKSLDWCLKGSRVTFRKIPAPESEVMLRARLAAEERQYQRMFNKRKGEEGEQQDLGAVKRVVAYLFNGILSIAGVGVATFIVSSRTIGWSLEACILLTFFACLLVLIAEVFLLALYMD
jgi:hypothetical protein